MVRELPRLEPLEVVSGVVLGPRRAAAAARPHPRRSPRSTLESLLLEPLAEPPCVVAFSGGRDSSALLAEATRVARTHGLEEPVPHTLRFAAHPRTREDDWQEMVVRHLGLGEWTRREVDWELDALGPLARRAMRAHGVHWPPNAHTMALLLEAAKGGSLLTGSGGDELFTGWPWARVWRIRRGKALPRRWDLRPLALSLLPPRVHARLSMARHPFLLPWLISDAQREVARGFAVEMSRRQSSWAEALEDHLAGRPLELALSLFGAMAAEADVRLVQPFYESRYVRAVAAAAPPDGYHTRQRAMETHFGDLLPAQLLGRSTKAVFTGAFAGPATRRFAREWSGAGLDHAMVDADALRREWLAPVPDIRSLVALQAAWLAGD